MQAMLVRSRYKVTQILHAQEGYAAMQAVDVESRDKKEYLLNVYEGDFIKRYVDFYDRLRHCPAYKGLVIDQDSLVAVFDWVGGTPIDRVFYRGAKIGWEKRLVFAQQLFHLGLSMADYPPEIACAALLSENLRLWPEEERLAVRYQIEPLAEMNAREVALLLTDQAKKILLRRYDSPDAEIAFLESLEETAFQTPVELYRHWSSNRGEITVGYEALYAKGRLQRWLYLLFRNLLRGIKRLWKRRRKR